MFIHRTNITGLSDRGAWPWRPSRFVRSWPARGSPCPAPCSRKASCVN